jgi:ribonucleoside-diphosphate reductase alpha chain
MKGASGPKLEEIYMTAWETGLKTTYYLRTLGASQIEKSTLDAKKYGYTQKRDQGVAQAVANGAGGSRGAGAGNGNGNSDGAGAEQGGKAYGDGAQAASPESGHGQNGGDYIVEVKSLARPATEVTSFCALDDPECEACQ